MAVAVLGSSDEYDLMKKASRRLARRHYKKDSRFVLDLYTLTYDSHESLDSLGDLSKRRSETTDTQNLTIDKTFCVKSVSKIKNTRSPYTFRSRRQSFQSRLQDGENLSETEDNHIEDETYSLPIFQSKRVLNNTDNNSLPNDKVPQTNFSSLTPKMNLNHESSQNNNSNTDKSFGKKNTRKESEINHLNKIWKNTRWSLEDKNGVETTKTEIQEGHQQQPANAVTSTLKTSLKKVDVDTGNCSDTRVRISKQMLTKMNSNQLQTVIFDLRAYVEYLNEQLMKMFLERDELHMTRESLLVNIEDITAYLNTKQVYVKSDYKNYLSRENFKKKSIHGGIMHSSSPKTLISNLQFNRLTSYIRN